ncbi:hypothetical protein JTB14_001560 [Gonioctena quinquepunctata]|nr:hypothetical protein JTB14_001560 [Gonioctena quinquepunctata]
MPPIFGALGQLNFHLMPLEESSSDILTSSRKLTFSLSSRSAPTKFVPLSDRICFGCPRRQIKRLIARIVELISRDAATSICTVLIVSHVKRMPHGNGQEVNTNLCEGKYVRYQSLWWKETHFRCYWLTFPDFAIEASIETFLDCLSKNPKFEPQIVYNRFYTIMTRFMVVNQ